MRERIHGLVGGLLIFFFFKNHIFLDIPSVSHYSSLQPAILIHGAGDAVYLVGSLFSLYEVPGSILSTALKQKQKQKPSQEWCMTLSSEVPKDM